MINTGKKKIEKQHISHNHSLKDRIHKDFINSLYSRNIPIKKIRIKIDETSFKIPEYKEYYYITDNNYSVPQLKKICKYYELKLTGNKDELNKRLYNFLLYSNHSIIIQKLYRSHLIKTYIKLHGPGFYLRNECVNPSDFCTLDDLKDIPYTQFFSFKDEDNFIYGFDILSLYNLYLNNKTQLENPFTTKIINKQVYHDVIKYIKLSKLLKINIKIDYEKVNNLSESKELEMKILTLFQTMDSLGNYTNISWFNDLDRYDLIKYLRELIDIWNYRANLEDATKREICYPHGNPFRVLSFNVRNIYTLNEYTIRKNIVNVFDEMINKGINNDSRALGCYYILSALTLVSNDAADALPWLYESVNYEQNTIIN